MLDSTNIKQYFDVVLEDDDTPYGGTAFQGETVKDFIETLNEPIEDITFELLNETLVDCGIKPINRQFF